MAFVTFAGLQPLATWAQSFLTLAIYRNRLKFLRNFLCAERSRG